MKRTRLGDIRRAVAPRWIDVLADDLGWTGIAAAYAAAVWAVGVVPDTSAVATSLLTFAALGMAFAQTALPLLLEIQTPHSPEIRDKLRIGVLGAHVVNLGWLLTASTLPAIVMMFVPADEDSVSALSGFARVLTAGCLVISIRRAYLIGSDAITILAGVLQSGNERRP